MEFNNSIPIYIQVIDKIKQDLVTKKLKPGDKMPSTRDFAQEIGLNFNTVARVYKELEMENIVYTKRGLGTFITDSTDIIENIRSEMARNLLDNFIDGMLKIGYSHDDIINLIENNKRGEYNE